MRCQNYIFGCSSRCFIEWYLGCASYNFLSGRPTLKLGSLGLLLSMEMMLLSTSPAVRPGWAFSCWCRLRMSHQSSRKIKTDRTCKKLTCPAQKALYFFVPVQKAFHFFVQHKIRWARTLGGESCNLVAAKKLISLISNSTQSFCQTPNLQLVTLVMKKIKCTP